LHGQELRSLGEPLNTDLHKPAIRKVVLNHPSRHVAEAKTGPQERVLRPEIRKTPLQGRKDTEVLPLGERCPIRQTSTLTRAEVRDRVLEARANGTLIPAGQGEYAGVPEEARQSILAKARAATGDDAIASLGK